MREIIKNTGSTLLLLSGLIILLHAVIPHHHHYTSSQSCFNKEQDAGYFSVNNVHVCNAFNELIVEENKSSAERIHIQKYSPVDLYSQSIEISFFKITGTKHNYRFDLPLYTSRLFRECQPTRGSPLS